MGEAINTKLRDSILTSVMSRITVSGERLEYLRKAAISLQEALLEDKKLAVSLALNAFIPNSIPDRLLPAQEALAAHWETFVSEVKDGGLPYLRAVVILALMEAANKDTKLASALWLALHDPLKRQDNGIEHGLRERALSELRQIHEGHATTIWKDAKTRKVAVKADDVQFQVLENGEVKLAEALSDASANGQAIVSVTGTYVQTPSPEVTQEWAETFGKKAAAAMVSLLESTLEDMKASLDPFLKDAVRAAQASHRAASASTLAERRLSVMWWMQARYSEELDRPYRTLTPVAAAAQMAFDLVKIVPLPATAELEAVLVEAWYQLFNEGDDKKVTLGAAIEEIARDPALASTFAAEASSVAGYRLLTDAIRTSQQGGNIDVGEWIGVPESTLVTPPALAIWVFRNWQVEIIAT